MSYMMKKMHFLSLLLGSHIEISLLKFSMQQLGKYIHKYAKSHNWNASLINHQAYILELLKDFQMLQNYPFKMSIFFFQYKH